MVEASCIYKPFEYLGLLVVRPMDEVIAVGISLYQFLIFLPLPLMRNSINYFFFCGTTAWGMPALGFKL